MAGCLICATHRDCLDGKVILWETWLFGLDPDPKDDTYLANTSLTLAEGSNSRPEENGQA